jgi:hypothetical protein
MDFTKTLRNLLAEKAKLDRVIASLEELQSGGNGASSPVPGRRCGRKSMEPAERQAVSERMKKYWAKRREQQRPVDERETNWPLFRMLDSMFVLENREIHSFHSPLPATKAPGRSCCAGRPIANS